MMDRLYVGVCVYTQVSTHFVRVTLSLKDELQTIDQMEACCMHAFVNVKVTLSKHMDHFHRLLMALFV